MVVVYKGRLCLLPEHKPAKFEHIDQTKCGNGLTKTRASPSSRRSPVMAQRRRGLLS